jgi:peroxiredoxin
VAEGIYRFLKSDGEEILTVFARRRFTIAKPGSGCAARGSRPIALTDVTERNDAMTIKVGDRIPDVKLVKATESGPEAVQSADYFAGKKVALFAVPGAFTPTCSAKHLPGYVEKADELKAKGVDEIVATAVNDAFVLGAWAKAGDAGNVTMLADGNGDFAEALGLSMDGTGFGMGKRSKRYSMIVDDGVVSELNIEAPGDFSVSSAEYLLAQL